MRKIIENQPNGKINQQKSAHLPDYVPDYAILKRPGKIMPDPSEEYHTSAAGLTAGMQQAYRIYLKRRLPWSLGSSATTAAFFFWVAWMML